MIINTPSVTEPEPTRPSSTSDTRNFIVRGACGAVLAGVTLLMALSFAGCRTTEGLGRDFEALGDNVADSADKHTP